MHNLEYSVRVSFLELYNEEIFDLMSPQSDISRLRLYEDATRKGSVIIQVLAIDTGALLYVNILGFGRGSSS